MSFTLSGFSGYVEQLKAHRYFKILVIVPCLIVLGIGSYSVGRMNASPANENPGVASEKRFRREVTQPPNVSRQIVVNTGGAIYTRWGRTECPEGIDTVYTGITGGSWYHHHGGGSNPLCLPMDPIWGTYNEAVEKASKLYGAEYENPTGFDFRNVGNKAPHDHDIPCVVCQHPARTTALMIPARNICYNGWNLEYSGYLMAGHQGHHGRSQFICVDGSPESDLAGFRNDEGALFYNVEGVCGSLPCPPYVSRREITCAVCTK